MELSTEMMYVIDFAIIAVLAVIGWFIAPRILPDSYENTWSKAAVAVVGALLGAGAAYFFHNSMGMKSSSMY